MRRMDEERHVRKVSSGDTVWQASETSPQAKREDAAEEVIRRAGIRFLEDKIFWAQTLVQAKDQ